jgi:hypothetical protein
MGGNKKGLVLPTVIWLIPNQLIVKNRSFLKNGNSRASQEFCGKTAKDY